MEVKQNNKIGYKKKRNQNLVLQRYLEAGKKQRMHI